AYPLGTAIVRVADNGDDLAETLGELARRHHVDVVPTDTTFVDAGISLGSNQVVALQTPRVLLAWDAPVSSQSAGWTRYVLEQQFGQRVSVVRVSTLGNADLSRFDVIVLPSGNYTEAIDGQVLVRSVVAADCRLDTLPVRAAVWPARLRGASLAARQRRFVTLRRDRAAVGQLRRGDLRAGAATREGLGVCRRHARDDGRGLALG